MIGATAAARKHKQEMAQKKRAHLETKRELEVRAKFREKEAKASKRKQDIIKKKADDDIALERAAKSASDAAEVRASKERAEAEEKVRPVLYIRQHFFGRRSNTFNLFFFYCYCCVFSLLLFTLPLRSTGPDRANKGGESGKGGRRSADGGTRCGG